DTGDAGPELAPVVDHAGERHAAEIYAVIGALTRDEHAAAALTTRVVVGERDLHRRVDRLGARVHEEDAVQITGRELGHALCQLETLRMATQEWSDEVELGELPVNRLDRKSTRLNSSH